MWDAEEFETELELADQNSHQWLRLKSEDADYFSSGDANWEQEWRSKVEKRTKADTALSKPVVNEEELKAKVNETLRN